MLQSAAAMKTKRIYRSNPFSITCFAIIPVLALVLLPGSTRADSLQVGIAPPGSANESNFTAYLTWTAAAGNTYLVQSSTNLGDPAGWTTEDAVSQTNDGTVRWMAPEALEVQKYYRLVLPQPQIFSVEPAVVAPGVPVDIYVLGESFGTMVLQINGVTQAGAVVVSSSLAMIPGFTPDLAGSYQVTLMVGGVVVSSFNVVSADPLTNPELVLQGPPDEPPAGPSAFRLSKRGYDYYKARSDLAAAGAASNPYFHNNENAGDMPGLAKKDFKGHVTLLKAFDDGSDSSSARPRTKTGHVTLLKAFDDGSDDRTAGGHAWNNVPGYVAGGDGASAPTHTKTGHVTLMKAFDDEEGARVKVTFNNAPIISLFSGEVQESDVDLTIPGRGLDFVWTRTYHSRIGRFGSATNGWTFSYDVRCVQNSSGGLDVYDGSGRKDTFTPGANGVYTCPEIFREGTLSNNTFTLAFADTGRWVFNPFDGTSSAGKLIQIITRNGDTMTLGYDTSGRLAQVVDDLGRTNTMTYNTSGQLASVTDCSGRSVTYQYYSGAKSDNGSAGDLQSVTSPPVTGTPNRNDFPSGKTTTYTYSKSFPLDRENHLLLTVTDPKGQTAAVFTYEHSSTSANYLRCIAAQEGTNTASCFTYSAFTGTPHVPVLPASWGIVNDPVGNVSQYYFDARNRCLIEDDYTGRATPGLPVTDTVNRPTGQVRATDPAYYETTWSWNNDSLCTVAVAPGGQQMQYVYQSDLDSSTPARKRADLRVVREFASSPVDLDGDGVADVTSRAYYFTYDPRFGSEATTSGESREFRRRNDSLLVAFTGLSSGSSKVRGTSSADVLWDGTVERKAIGAKGTGSVFRGWDGTVKGLFVPDGSGVAINTKGTGADKNRTAGGPRLKGWDGTIKGLVVPDGNGVAIKTKGTGADPNRVSAAAQSPNDGDLDFNDESTAYNFAVSVTDPRGNMTTASYDGQGNLASFRKLNGRTSYAPITMEADFGYDPHGQLTSITNAADATGRSRVDTFSWSQGQITNSVVDAGGLALTESYEYDVRGNLTRYVDPRTNDWLFTYNTLDQLVQASSALTANGSLSTFRTASQFAYDANDNPAQVATDLRDASGNLQGSRTENFQYDGEDRLAQLALAVDATHALTNRYVYDGNDQCVQMLGGDAVSGADPNQTAAYQYDERGLLFQAIAAPGSSLADTNGFDYDANGALAAIHIGGNGGTGGAGGNATGGARYFSWDGFGRLATATDPMGNQTVCFYDANDNLKVVRQFGELNDVPGSAGNVRLAESSRQYDGLDRCVSARDLFFNPATQSPIGSGPALTTLAYASNGECVAVTDTLGHTTTCGYDTACRPVSVTDVLGNQQSVVYDANGNPLVVMSSEIPAVGGKAQVLAVTNIHDSLNRRVSTTDSAGNTSSCAYDSLGRCVQTTDPRGVHAFYSYDLLDRCTVAIGDLNGDGVPDFTQDITTTYSWSSSSGNLLAVTDSNTNTTSYAYDSLGRGIGVTHANGTREQMSWSPLGNLIGVQDANGTTITNTYDLSDRIVHRDIAARTSAGVAATTTFETFTYDGCNRLTGAANDGGTNAFTYDSLDNCVSETLNGLTTASTYDAFGNRLSLTYPGGRALTYTYDALSRCATVSDSGQPLANYAYDGPARVSVINYGNGTRTQIAYDGFVGTPNAQGDYGFGQIRRIRHSVPGSSVIIDDRTFGYDPDQNKTARNMTSPFTLGGAAQLQSFQYDPAGRLVGALVTTNGATARLTTYGLDRMGNRTNVTGEACSGDYTLSPTIPPGDFEMNRYTATPCDSRTYDSDGNLASVSSAAGPVTYQYDYAGRLVQVQALNSGLGTLAPLASYAYDALGRRISKTVYPGGLPPATTQYLYDGDGVVEERSGRTTTATYVCRDGVQNGNETDLDCGGACLTMRRAGQDYYFHTDDQGNVLALSGATGGVVERCDYDDYGAVTFLTSDGYPTAATSSAIGNAYLWRGLRLDPETGLHNDDGGGYFEPQTGRYILRAGVPMQFDAGTDPWSPIGPPLPACMK
jgi:YD repeat-containing protein